MTDHDDRSDGWQAGEESDELREDGVFLSCVSVSISTDDHFWRDLRSGLVSYPVRISDVGMS